MIKHKKFVFVNSRDRMSGTDSNFTYKIELPKDKHFDRIVVVSASIPKSYYLVPTGSTFTLRELGVNTVITVPAGNYSIKSFRITVQALLNANTSQGWIYAITNSDGFSNVDTGKYTFTVTNNGVNQPSFIFTKALFEQFGFDINSTNTMVGNTMTSKNILKFQSEDVLLIHSDLCNNEGNDILQEVFSSSTGSLSAITFENKAPETTSRILTTSNSEIYRFSITNESNEVLDFNGINTCFLLMIYKSEDVNDLIAKYIKYKLLKE